jgi:hypothetical protein
MNLTTLFLGASLNIELDSFLKLIAEIDDGISDALTGSVSLFPLLVTSSFVATIPYIPLNVRMFVPCPKAIQ